MRRVTLIGRAGLALWLAGWAVGLQAQTINFGNVQLWSGTFPTDLREGGVQNDAHAWLFTEHVNLTLSQDETVNAVSPGVYDAESDLGSYLIPQGTKVNVYLLHSDPMGEPSQPRIYQGSITFPFPILGVIAKGRRLRLSDPQLGVPGTLYSQSDNYRGYELGDWSGRPGGPERFEIGTDGRTLVFFAGTTNVVDELRILTVPEPASLSVLGIALGTLWVRRRRRTAC
ncbi:hypothetical protein HRbin15_00756 [bacterium HR15]|nr:hypothetical protein HRbin15_00756 [bacterium HR15]